MAVTIGSARIDENGHAYGGKAGDQTGNECSTQSWYKHSKGWRVLRAVNPTVRTRLAASMKAACANNHIGYDQYERNSLYNEAAKYGFDVSKVTRNVETDCSALVRVCIAYAAGITSLPASMRTTNMCELILKTGAFVELNGSKYTDSADYLAAGDILCTKTQGHTVIVLTNGSKVEKSIPNTTAATGNVVVSDYPLLKRGDSGEYVKLLQMLIMKYDATYLPQHGADGDFGVETKEYVLRFQRAHGLETDGIVGELTWGALLKYKEADIEVTGYTVNLRDGAGTEFKVIGLAHRGDKVRYNEKMEVGATTWYHTASGWISGKYTKEI